MNADTTAHPAHPTATRSADPPDRRPDPEFVGVDPVALQVLRSRLLAVAEEGAITIERTAISPVISESRDYSCTLMEANGDLIIAGGAIASHFGVCRHAVRTTMAAHDDIAPGDVFFSNDPHNGGGLHAQDVVIQLPIFVGDRLVAWVANSGHMIDMGGMVFGSWTPDATDCYQEALRLPPVRLFRRGVEQRDVWQIIRTNIRTPDLVEMDLRGLVAGCEVARDKLVAIADDLGAEGLLEGVGELRRRAEAETRRRIGQLADGVYRYRSWVEWHDEQFEIPCALTVDGDTMTFDFTGAPPQTTHFFNTVPHIVTAQLVGDGADVLTHDLPLSEGMFAPVTVICPAGSVVSSSPPAPVASAHIDVTQTASMVAHQCLALAIAASEGSDVERLLVGPPAPSAMAIQIWSYTTPLGQPDGWMMLDGAMAGTSAAFTRDGTDLQNFLVGRKSILDAIDVEVLEAWYPVLVDFKRIRPGAFGAGRFRGGAGCNLRFRPHGVDAVVGQLLAVRERFPLNGTGGGMPGSSGAFERFDGDGSATSLPGKSGSVSVGPGEALEFAIGSAGGHGDPFERDPAAVARDVRTTRITEDEARHAYGVVVVDGHADLAATDQTRTAGRADRLGRASAAARPRTEPAAPGDAEGPRRRLVHGVETCGATAFAVDSGAVLAHAPDAWTDGCPTLETELAPGVVQRTYLDPVSGAQLLVEVVPPGAPCSVESRPHHWTAAG